MPNNFSTIKQAEDFLLGYSPQKLSGQTYTLGRMKLLMERLGNPQNDIPAVHVAGTSGKTSTSYFIRALLEAHGKKTGLTASPHIVSITERVQIGGVPLNDQLFLRYLHEFIELLSTWPDLQPTYFELLVAFAFWVFKKEQVEYMIIEVGLGGLLDATNVITNPNKIAVITPTGLDHTEVLGNTIEEIAWQKAGIISRKLEVFSAHQDSMVAKVISSVSNNHNSNLRIIEPDVSKVTGSPLFQQANFALAKGVVRFIVQRDKLVAIANTVEDACITNTPPGRFEIYNINDKMIVLDGAHNPQKLAAFKQSFEARFPGETTTWLVGLLSAPNEKIEVCIAEINRQNDNYIFTDFSVGQDVKGRRSADSHQLHTLATKSGMQSIALINPTEALDLLLTSKKRTLIITGSLYLIAQLRQKILTLQLMDSEI